MLYKQKVGFFFIIFVRKLLVFIFSCQSKSPGFSVKLLDNSYALPAPKPLTQYSQLGAIRKQPLKFQLADKPYKSLTQPHYSEKSLDNFNPPRQSQLQDNFHYQTIKIIDRKRQEHSPPLSNDYASRNENIVLGLKRNLQEPTQKYNLKSFLNQFKKEDKKKVNPVAHASTQPVQSKWSRFMDDTENYEAAPSCSKWDDYLRYDEDSFVYQSPPIKRKISTCFKFDSSPQNAVAKRPTTTYNFLELGLNKERPVYSRPRSPPEHFSTQFVDSTQYRQPYFAPTTQNYLPQEETVFFNQQMVPHNQYFPQQPAVHYVPPPSMFPPQTQCTHCACCQGGGSGYSSPKRGPYMPPYYSQLPSQPDEELYTDHF